MEWSIRRTGNKWKIFWLAGVAILAVAGHLLLPLFESGDYVAKLKSRGLPLLEGRVPTFYSDGYKPRAEQIQALMEEMLAFYGEQLSLNTELHLAVLTQSDWEATTRRIPYGIPAVAGEPPLAGLPATPGGAVHQSALSLQDQLSQNLLEEILAEGMSYEEAVGAFVDLIALHEFGHYLADKYGIESPTRWLSELVATYFGYTFLAERKPRLQRIWDLVATKTYLESPRPGHTSLADFERLYLRVGVHNYCWYQAAFNRRVSEISPRHGFEFISELKREFPAHRSETEKGRGSRSSADAGELLRKLDRIAPGFTAWANELEL